MNFYLFLVLYFVGLLVSLGGAAYAAGREGKRLHDYLDDDFRKFCHSVWPVGLLFVCVFGIGMLGEAGFEKFIKRFSRFSRWISTPWRRLHELGEKHRDDKDNGQK